MSYSYATSAQATIPESLLVQNQAYATLNEFDVGDPSNRVDGSLYEAYHTRGGSGQYPKGTLNAVEDQDFGQNYSLQRRSSLPGTHVLIAGTNSTAAAAAMAASGQAFAFPGLNSPMGSIGNGSANPAEYAAGNRPGLRVNVPRANQLPEHDALVDVLGLTGPSDILGLDVSFLHPNSTSESTATSERERAHNNDASHIPGALSPLSAFSPASGGPHSPSATQFPPPSPYATSPHSPYPVSPEGHHSSGAISPALPLPVPSPISLSPQFGPTGSNTYSRSPKSPKSPMRPVKGHTPSRSQTQPIGDDILKARSFVGKVRGKSPATRSNTGTVTSTPAPFSYSVQDPVMQGGAYGTGTGSSAHQRVSSHGHVPAQSTGLARSPSGGLSRRNDNVGDRFSRGRGHSVGNANRTSVENATHPYLASGPRYESSVVAQSGSARGHDTGSLGGSRNASPFATSSPLPGGIELSVSNLALMNTSYGGGNTLTLPINVERAPSRRGSGSSLGDINGPLGLSQASDNEYQFDMAHSSQLLAPPSASPHSPLFNSNNPFGSPHSPQLEIPYSIGSPSAHQLPPLSPLEVTSGASSPAQVLSPWATHHSSPAFLAVGSNPDLTSGHHGLGLTGAVTLEIPTFQDLGPGLLSSSPPYGAARSQEVNTLDIDRASAMDPRAHPQQGFQTQQQLIDKLAQEDAMMLDIAMPGANVGGDQSAGAFASSSNGTTATVSATKDGLSGIHLIPSPMAASLQILTPGDHAPEYGINNLPGQSFNYGESVPQQQAYEMQNTLSFEGLAPPQHLVSEVDGNLHPLTVPPTPSTGTILPWSGQPGVALAPGGLEQWQEQQVRAVQVLQAEAGANGGQSPTTLLVPKPGRPPTFRRRSYSTYDQPMPMPDLEAPVMVQGPAFSSNTTSFARDGGVSTSMDDVYLGTDGQLRRKKGVVSASAGIINAHKRARSFNPPPTINITNWDSRPPLPSPLAMGGHGQPQPPPFIQTQTLQPNPEQIASPASASSINSPYNALLYAQAGSFSPNEAYPPRSPAENVFSGPNQSLVSPPSATPSSSSSSMVPGPIKVKQQGQRHEVNEAMLSKAFTPHSDYPNPGLRVLLELVRMSPFYLNEQMEPMLGTQDAEYLLEQVRRLVPNDPRFVSRLQEGGDGDPSTAGTSAGISGGNGDGGGDNGARDAQSIYMLFTESNQCLICGKQTDRSGRALGHVRSDIGHRPYHCTCEKCISGNNPRKFFSENLLDDHLKGQVVKQECVVCHNFFRRGGMKRHMNSKHPEVHYKPGDDHDGDDEA
ncbi:hypothetical protein FRC17_003335 [Serendipita sp. 399]|nr:hypothetical protein FRC17_003335 [Serendipita sp. 399]